jgi:hypothetical protein
VHSGAITNCIARSPDFDVGHLSTEGSLAAVAGPWPWNVWKLQVNITGSAICTPIKSQSREPPAAAVDAAHPECHSKEHFKMNQTSLGMAASLMVATAGALSMSGCGTPETTPATPAAPAATAKGAAGYGPQSPRDIDRNEGTNPVVFSTSPAYQQMNLCNIHIHKFAEHKGGQFTTYAGPGDGQGHDTGYRYSGSLSPSELRPVPGTICPDLHGGSTVLKPGDTIEAHYVYSTAPVKPGDDLGACSNDYITNPQLRVNAQVYVLVNDTTAADFLRLTATDRVNGFYQAPYLPTGTGRPVDYAGSTTGPKYNTKGSSLQVSWSVRPEVLKVNIVTVGMWCTANHRDAEGVRNLVVEPAFLSPISMH